MANIDNNDLNENENEKMTEDDLEQVKGGPAYIKFDGVDGESKVFPKVEIDVRNASRTVGKVYPKIEPR